jgi:hypothetical protein
MQGVRGDESRGRLRGGRLVVVLAGGLVVAGCTSGGSLFGSSSPASAENTSTSGTKTSFTDRMSAFFLGSPAPAGTGMAGPTGDVDCPTMDIRQGASTYSVAAPGQEANATNLRYQASIARASRECAVLGATMTIKVGLQGRVLLGPAGGPGQVDVPVRLALVHEGMQPKTVWTKFYRIPVTVPTGQTNVSFVHIEEDMTVPTPSAAELDDYIIYVGFDPNGIKEPEKRAPRGKKPR